MQYPGNSFNPFSTHAEQLKYRLKLPKHLGVTYTVQLSTTSQRHISCREVFVNRAMVTGKTNQSEIII
jgi:hypothetical protein